MDLMVGKSSRILVDTHSVLQLLARLGNSAEFATWRMICQGSGENTHSQLWEAVRGRATGESVSGTLGKMVLSAICEQHEFGALKWARGGRSHEAPAANPEWGYERPPSHRLFRLPFLPCALSGDGTAATGTTLRQL